MNIEITQAQRDANTHAHLQGIADGQKAKRDALQAHRLEMYPWILKAREIQKQLLEKEANK